MNKEDYILRSLLKVSNKKWEFFIISRIIHNLSDDQIEFVTQQLVRRPDGSRALTDLFFPQFGIHLEIDEPFHNNQNFKDFKREQDIIQITNHSVRRIKISNEKGEIRDLNAIRSDIDAFTQEIAELKLCMVKDSNFTPWDLEKKYTAENIIARGRVSISDNVVFRKQIEAMRCFGFKGKGWQKGGWKIPDGTNDILWFPRLFEHGIWKNELSSDGTKIYERAINDDAKLSIIEQKKDHSMYPNRKIIVFAKALDPLGFKLLRYIGNFKVDLGHNSENEMVFNRVDTEEPVRIF